MSEPTAGHGFGFYRPGTPGPATQVADRPAESPEETDPVLADDTELDLDADEARQRVEETLARLDAELVGLAQVKRRVHEIAALLLVDRARRQFRLESSRPRRRPSCGPGPTAGGFTCGSATTAPGCRGRDRPGRG